MVIKEVLINFKVTETKRDEYERYWRTNGYRSRSDFLRQSADATMTGGRRKAPTVSANLITESNIHLNRINSVLMQLLTSATNDNLPVDDGFEKKLNTALRDINVIRKQVS